VRVGQRQLLARRRLLLHPLTKCSFISNEGRIKNASCVPTSLASMSTHRLFHYLAEIDARRLLARPSPRRLCLPFCSFRAVRTLFSRRRRKQIGAYMLLACWLNVLVLGSGDQSEPVCCRSLISQRSASNLLILCISIDTSHQSPLSTLSLSLALLG